MRCLIVDDNTEFLEAARRLLEREGISVVGVATNSAEAIRQVTELQPDVTLVDVNLGEESGFELARQLVASNDDVSTRVILISTYAQRDLVGALPTGSNIKFLSKADLSGAAVRAALGVPADGDAAG